MSDTYVKVARVDGMGMLTLRADLSSEALNESVQENMGYAIPKTGTFQMKGTSGSAWMSPDELMVFCADQDRADTMDKLTKIMGDTHHLLVDVSDARAVFDLEGEGVREVLAKLSPADVMSMSVGEFRRTRFGQVPGAFWISSETTAHVICFRSVGDYMHGLLERSSQSGSEVKL